MAESVPRLYWDSSVFICLLNKEEEERRHICENILRHAEQGEVSIVTSTLTIVEVIRPRGSGFSRLQPEEIEKVGSFFKHQFILKVNLDERISLKAVELARAHNLRPNDAIHAATAILSNVKLLQAWDRDYSVIGHLVAVDTPKVLEDQQELFPSLQDRPPEPS
jgi:predicted nucleic acid-binding protein